MRFWEIDAARGIAVLMMIAFHFLYDLNYFAGYNFMLSSGFWLAFACATVIIFLLLVGVSLSISYARAENLARKEIWLKYVRRGIRIFIYGLIITAVTLIAFPGNTIWFGVLHLIGLSIILAIPFLPKRKTALFLGLAFIVMGLLLAQSTASFPWLFWLGFMPANFYTFDYVPLLPWFGVVLLGLFFGKTFYDNRKPKLPSEYAKPICWLGRHSLLVYFLHQLVLVAVVMLALSF